MKNATEKKMSNSISYALKKTKILVGKIPGRVHLVFVYLPQRVEDLLGNIEIEEGEKVYLNGRPVSTKYLLRKFQNGTQTLLIHSPEERKKYKIDKNPHG